MDRTANVAAFEARRAELEKVEADARTAAQARADGIAKLSISISHKAGEEGRLFGSVGTADIADAVTAAGVPLEKHEVRLPDGPLRELGEFEIELGLHGDVAASVTITVIAEA